MALAQSSLHALGQYIISEQGGQVMKPVYNLPREAIARWSGPIPFNSEANASGKRRLAQFLFFCILMIIARQSIMIRQHVTQVDISAVDTYAFIDIAIVCLVGVVLLFSGSIRPTWSALRRTPVVWLYGYYLICAASFVWSAAPIYSLYRAIEYLVLLSAALAAMAQFRNFTAAERAFLYVTAVTILLQMCVNLRLYGFSFSLQDWHTNSYSASSAIMFCYCLGEYLTMTGAQSSENQKRRRRLRWFGIFSLGTLALGTSGGSNVAAMVGCLLIFLALSRLGLLLALLMGGFIYLLWGGIVEFFRNLLLPGKSEYALETASSRTLIWKLYWHRFLQSPVLGGGFGVISEGRDKVFAALSHNSFFTVLIGTGIVGLVFFSLFMVHLWLTTIA